MVMATRVARVKMSFKSKVAIKCVKKKKPGGKGEVGWLIMQSNNQSVGRFTRQWSVESVCHVLPFWVITMDSNGQQQLTTMDNNGYQRTTMDNKG